MRKHHIRWVIVVFVPVLLISSLLQTCQGEPGVGVEEQVSSDKIQEDPLSSSTHQEARETEPQDEFCETTNNNHSSEPPSLTIEDEKTNDTPSDGGTTVHPTEFFGIFKKLGSSWHSVLRLLIKAVGSASGTTHRRDVYAESTLEALTTLKEMIATADAKLQSTKKSHNDYTKQQWKFPTVPYNEFGKTLDDVLLCFIHWAAADGTPDDTEKCPREGSVNGRATRINVSKAFRRLENYAEWMNDVDLMEPSLTANSLRDIWNLFSMQITYDDCHRLVWWLDLSKVDLDGLKQVPPKDIHRLFVWFSHFILFDTNAQENGMVFMSGLAHIHFWPFMTMLPLELGMKLDEFVISVIPMKTKFVVLMERPPWCKFAFQLLKPFLKSDMQRRMIVIEEGLHPTSFVYDVLGCSSTTAPDKTRHQPCIPMGFADLQGTPNVDVINDYYYSKLASNQEPTREGESFNE